MEKIIDVAYGASVKAGLTLLEKNLLPDLVIRRLIRLLLASRLRSVYKPTAEMQLSDLLRFVDCKWHWNIYSCSFSTSRFYLFIWDYSLQSYYRELADFINFALVLLSDYYDDF